MPAELIDMGDEPETEEPVAPVQTDPTHLKDEPDTEEPITPVTTELTDLEKNQDRGARRYSDFRAHQPDS